MFVILERDRETNDKLTFKEVEVANSLAKALDIKEKLGKQNTDKVYMIKLLND